MADHPEQAADDAVIGAVAIAVMAAVHVVTDTAMPMMPIVRVVVAVIGCLGDSGGAEGGDGDDGRDGRDTTGSTHCVLQIVIIGWPRGDAQAAVLNVHELTCENNCLT